jgi:hypothetical protein
MALGGAMGVDRDLSVDATGGVAGAVLAGKRHTLASAPESQLVSLCRPGLFELDIGERDAAG